MKRFLFLLLIICWSAAAHAVAYPSLEQIATKLYANYSVREMETTEKVSYQKKRDGWHVAYMVYNDTINRYEVRKEQLYWSSALGKYMNLDMFPHGNTGFASARVATDIRSAQSYDFQRCPYFGYDGWDGDVLADFADYNGTNDTIYEGLARAYSNFAQGYTSHQYAFHLPAQQTLKEKDRVDLYIANEKKAIAVYDNMRKRNPHFEVLIGEVSTKYFNEVMATYDELLYYGREAEMKEYFKEEFYDPLMRSVALNMLESVAPNGILFTYGDNDSYPLWYLQWIKGIRPDIAVMNTSLMNTSRYLSRFRNGFLKTAPIIMSISDSVYREEGVFYRDPSKSVVQVNSERFFTKQIYAGEYKEQPIMYYTPGKIVVHCPKELYNQYELLSEEDSTVITLESSYLVMGDMAVMDVVLNNFVNRPVYSSVSALAPKFLEHCLFIEGMVRRFIPARERTNSFTLSFMGPVASATIFQKNIKKLLSADSACDDFVNGQRYRTSIKLSALHAAEVLLESDKAAALSMLNATYSFFPYINGKAEPIDAYALDIYYKAGDLKNGDALGEALLDHIEQQLTGYKYRKLTTEEQSERARERSALSISHATFDRYARPALSTRAQKINDLFPW